MIRIANPAILGVAAALLLATACSKSPQERMAEAAIERAAGGDVDVQRDGEQVSITNDEGSMRMSAGESLPLPADFPDDVYLPGSYKVNSVMDMGQVKAISLSTPMRVTQLFAEAGTAMKAQGWNQKMAMQQAAGNAILSFEKDTPGKVTRGVSLSFIESRSDEGNTIVSVQLQQSAQ